MKLSDLLPICVLPTNSHDVLYIHKDDWGKEMSVCLFTDRDSKSDKWILVMHQTQIYLTRSLIDYEIEQTPENIQFYQDKLRRKYEDEYLLMTLESFEKFRNFYNANWNNISSGELFDYLYQITEERDTIYRDYEKFYELIGRYPAEPGHKYPLTETGEYDIRNMEIIDKFYEDVKYTDDEIIFMAKYDFNEFSTKFPSLAEYYMECLDYFGL